MENLKMKFELNGLKFEVEGDSKTVREEFEAFKEFTKQLASTANFLNPHAPDMQKEKLLINGRLDDNSYPVLKDVIMLDLPKTEIEWVLIYAFYESDYGKEPFVRESLLSKYRDTGRYTDNRSKKFSENFKVLVSKKYIKSKNDTEYLFLEEGKIKANKILSGDDDITAKKKYSANKAVKGEPEKSKSIRSVSTKSTAEPEILHDLNLRPDGSESLKEYAERYRIENTEELYLIVVFYLKETLHIEKVTPSHIFTSFIELNKKVSGHLKQVLVNMRNSKTSNHWLKLEDIEDINYSIRGMNHIKHDIKHVKVNE